MHGCDTGNGQNCRVHAVHQTQYATLKGVALEVVTGCMEACKGWAGKAALLGAGAVHGTAWELERVRGNVTLAMLTLAIISVVASLGVFGKDRLVFWRESSSGQHPPGPVGPPARPTVPALHITQAMCISYHCRPGEDCLVINVIAVLVLDGRDGWTKVVHGLGHAAFDAGQGVGGSAAVLTWLVVCCQACGRRPTSWGMRA